VKYDAAGRELWVARLPSRSSVTEVAAVTVDAEGGVYVLGGAYRGPHLLTVKYDRDGNLLWSHAFGPPPSRYSAADLVVDREGNVYIAGHANRIDLEDEEPGRILVVKYDPDGQELWSAGFGRSGRAFALDVDPGGNVYVAGQVWVSELRERQATVARVSPAGELVWQVLFEGSATDLAVDEVGNIQVAGWSDCAERCRFAVATYGPGGREVGVVRFGEPLSDYYTRAFLALEAGGGMVAAGTALDDMIVARYVPPPPIPFLRGDANADGERDLSDAVATLQYLFLGEAPPPCLESADANDDGTLNVSDPVSLLDFLFRGGVPLPEPFAACGTDPSPDRLGCESFPPCV
jgi:hypothetical protein